MVDQYSLGVHLIKSNNKQPRKGKMTWGQLKRCDDCSKIALYQKDKINLHTEFK